MKHKLIMLLLAVAMLAGCSGNKQQTASNIIHEQDPYEGLGERITPGNKYPVDPGNQQGESDAGDNGSQSIGNDSGYQNVRNTGSLFDDQAPEVDEKDSFLLPDSDKRYITADELLMFTEAEIRIARNEIYARKGRIFKDQDLKEYFESKSWYEGRIEGNKFTDDMLNNYEIANIKLLLNYKASPGVDPFEITGFYYSVNTKPDMTLSISMYTDVDNDFIGNCEITIPRSGVEYMVYITRVSDKTFRFYDEDNKEVSEITVIDRTPRNIRLEFVDLEDGFTCEFEMTEFYEAP